MILDVNTALDVNHALTVTATSQFVLDLAGVGVGQPVTNKFGVSNTSFGEDIGIGDGVSPPNLLCMIGTTFTAAGSATMRVQLQAAVDTNNTGTPGTWDTIAQTDDIAVALLTAGTKLGEFTVPPRYPGQGFPRFYRLNYVIATGPMTAGAISFAGIITGRDDTPAYPAAY